MRRSGDASLETVFNCPSPGVMRHRTQVNLVRSNETAGCMVGVFVVHALSVGDTLILLQVAVSTKSAVAIASCIRASDPVGSLGRLCVALDDSGGSP